MLWVSEMAPTTRTVAALRVVVEGHPALRRTLLALLRLVLGMYSLIGRLSQAWRTHRATLDPDRAYDRWIELYDTLSSDDLGAMEGHARSLRFRPLVSIVMSVADASPRLLRESIDSVRAQLYDNWELCIADCTDPAGEAKEVLSRAAADPRIKVSLCEGHSGIAEASNKVAALAAGEYIGFLESDAVLRPHALLLLADELNRHPDPALVYSDSDKVGEHGNRCEHYFKPDWNAELLLSQNYVDHFAVVQRDCFAELGGFRQVVEGGHEWDLFLRVTEYVNPIRIRHIPHVLYHARTRGGPTVSAALQSASVEAGLRAVEDALGRRGVTASVSTDHESLTRASYALPPQPPGVEIVMPSACQLEFLAPCLDGLLHQTRYPDLRVIIVVSRIRFEVPAQAGFLREAESDPRVRLHVYDDRPYNFSWLNNTGAGQSDAPLLLLMNDDLRVIHEDWLEILVGHVLQDGVGAVGPMLYYPDDTIQHAGVILGLGLANHYHKHLRRGESGYHSRARCAQDLSCVTGGCMLIRREAFDSVGGLDEELAVAFNDVDFCIRLLDAGWRIVWTPHAELYHRESVSVGRHDSSERRTEYEREERIMIQRWADRLLNDPNYNPNLSREAPNTPAFPPRVVYPWRLPVRELAAVSAELQ
jgi:GT2 family glycosyltransferase